MQNSVHILIVHAFKGCFTDHATIGGKGGLAGREYHIAEPNFIQDVPQLRTDPHFDFPFFDVPGFDC